jgi:hypothetical protein
VKIILFFLVLSTLLIPQDYKTPLEKSDFTELTSYTALAKYVNLFPTFQNISKVDSVAQTVAERTIYFIRLSKRGFNKEKKQNYPSDYCSAKWR